MTNLARYTLECHARSICILPEHPPRIGGTRRSSERGLDCLFVRAFGHRSADLQLNEDVGFRVLRD